MTLLECLEEYEENGWNSFDYNVPLTELDRYSMRILSYDDYKFYDQKGNPVDKNSPMWLKLELATEWGKW
jgi:hypothetical protein